MDSASADRKWWARAQWELKPEPAPVLIHTGVAVLIEVIVVYTAVHAVLVALGHPQAGITHAVLPAVFAGLFAGLGSLGGHLRSGLIRVLLLGALAFPLTLIAIAVRPNPLAAAIALATVTAATGAMSWYGEPMATMGSIVLYSFFVPLVFGAGSQVPMKYLATGFVTMLVVTLVLRTISALIPFHDAPMRVKATDGTPAVRIGKRYHLVAQPKLTQLRRTTLRSAIALGLGAGVMSATGQHNAVWVLMTLIALVPPYLPLTPKRLLQRLVGTALAMIVLTTVDSLIPPGIGRMLILAGGLVLTIAYLKRSYAISVLGISMVAVLAYAQVHATLGVALLWRGFDTLVGAAIALVIVWLIPSTPRTSAPRTARTP